MIVVVRFGAINFCAGPVLHPMDSIHLSRADVTVPASVMFGDLNPTLIPAQFLEFMPIDGAGSNSLGDPCPLLRLALIDGSGGKCRSAKDQQDTEHGTCDKNSFFHDMPP
jgi:hypothetical protein